jgi:hypothetical protein
MFQVDEDGQEFLAQIQNWFRNGTQLDVQHQSYLTTLGAGGGSPVVDGANQTGSSIITDDWPNSITNVVKAGDLLSFQSINVVRDVTADASSDAGGSATISINPPFLSGGSPGDLSPIVVTASVVFKAKIVSLELPVYDAGVWIQPTLTFREDP